jgi:hypothetical protein
MHLADVAQATSRYAHMRAELEALMAQPIKDMPRIDHLVDALERTQLEIKTEMGITGNNPND